MNIFRAFTQTIPLAVLGFLLSLHSLAQQPPHISELSYLDRNYMDQQRASLDELARSNLGGQFNGEKAHDLRLLQDLLDRKLVRPNQKKELQSMGVIMGDLMAEELKLHWVIYQDSIGRSRALRYEDTENYLFPMTMISRRREAGNLSTVTDIYQRAVDLIQPRLPSLPFQ